MFFPLSLLSPKQTSEPVAPTKRSARSTESPPSAAEFPPHPSSRCLFFAWPISTFSPAPMLPISSREYKVMLRKAAFGGDRDQVSETALGFWKRFKDSVEDRVLGVSGKLDKWKEDRRIRFFDTYGQSLIERFFVLRERRDFSTRGRFELRPHPLVRLGRCVAPQAGRGRVQLQSRRA